MSVVATINILKASSDIVALVGSAITPGKRTADGGLPAISVKQISTIHADTLKGDAGLDNNHIQVDLWASTYAGVDTLAQLCRRVMQAAGAIHTLQLDVFDDQADLSGTYCITQEYDVWVNFS